MRIWALVSLVLVEDIRGSAICHVFPETQTDIWISLPNSRLSSRIVRLQFVAHVIRTNVRFGASSTSLTFDLNRLPIGGRHIELAFGWLSAFVARQYDKFLLLELESSLELVARKTLAGLNFRRN